MIEHIIKQFLFEQRRYTAVVKKAPTTSATKSKLAGAVYAFFVRFRFKPGSGVIPTEKQLYKELAAIISENTEVGKSSKYANGKYVYIVSNRLKESDNRLLFNVWIYTNDVYKSMSSTEADPDIPTGDTIEVSSFGNYYIGQSKMVSNPQFANLQNLTPDAAKLQKLAKTINTTPVSQETPDLGSNVKMAPVPAVNISSDENLPIDAVPQVSASNDIVTNTAADIIEYPYTTKEGFIVYTTGPTDDWVYTYSNNIWYGMKKPEFEQYQTTGGVTPTFYVIKNKTAINTLNKLANITPVVDNQKISDQPIKSVVDTKKTVKPEEKKIDKTDPLIANNLPDLSAGTELNLLHGKVKSIPVYVFKNGKFQKYGVYNDSKGKWPTFIRWSKDYKFFLVKFREGNFWLSSNIWK